MAGTGRGGRWRSTPRRATVAAASLIAAAMAVAACTTPAGTSDPWSHSVGELHAAAIPGGALAPKVLVVGDSLVDGLDPADSGATRVGVPTLTAALAAAGFGGRVEAAGGSTVADWDHGSAGVDDVAALATTVGPAHSLVALGTNDAALVAAASGSSQSAMREELEVEISAVASKLTATTARCVVLVAPSRHAWSGHAGYESAAGEVGDEMRSVAHELNDDLGSVRVVVADWHAASQSHPEWFFNAGEIHLTAAGYTAYRAFLADVLAAARSGALGC